MLPDIILLHGASSSGKTTLAKALQRTLPAPYRHYSIDHLRDSGVLPGPRPGSTVFEWQGMRDAVFDGFHASITAFAGAGNRLIIEHILDDAAIKAAFCEAVRPFAVFRVGLHTKLSALQARETRRPDRPAGSAARDYEHVHRGMLYNLELSGETASEGNAATVIAALHSFQT